MNKLLIIFILSIITLSPSKAKEGVTYTAADSIRIVKLLRSGQTSTLYFARQFLGIPYVAHTLEVNDEEQLVVNTRQLDCTTLVETVTALTLCAQNGETTFADYTKRLRQLRYRGGIIENYPSRLHYFSDWITDKERMGIVEEIQSPVPPFSGVQKLNINFMSRYPQSYKALKAHPEHIDVIRQQEHKLTGLTFRFIPKQKVYNTALLRKTVHDGDIIAITCSKPGLDIAHLGFAVWKKDGLHLLNASQLHKKVVEEPMTLRKYLSKHASHTGIRIIRVKRE
jgi:hypothetical protein